MRARLLLLVITVAVASIVAIAWNDARRWGYSRPWGWESASAVPAAIAGRAAAYRDLLTGHHRLLGYGGARPSRFVYADLLRARFGIEMHEVAACVVSQQQAVRWGTYNAVMADAIAARFGATALRDTALTAERIDAAQRANRRRRQPHAPR